MTSLALTAMLALALAAWALAASASARPLAGPATAGIARFGSAPSLPAGAAITGAVSADTPMHVTVALQPRDPEALNAFAEQVSTPGSALYRQYITPAQFAERFGATADQLQAVESSLRAHGLEPGTPAANNLSIPVNTTAAALGRAFDVSFGRVALAGGATAIVNQQAPALDRAVSPDVQAVLGLNTLSHAKPLLVRPHAAAPAPPAPPARAHVVTGGPQPCADAANAAQTKGGYTADEIASAYGLPGLYTSGGPGGAADQGAGQTVAILELESYDVSDIANYAQCYGATPQLANVDVDGGAGAGPGSGEAALDIENVLGLAPQSSIIVYEGPNSGAGPYDTFSAIISQHAAHVVSASWGECEPANGFGQAAAENTLFQEAAAQGQSILSAAGDDGAEDCFPSSVQPEVDDPSSQPYVTGVGGTRLNALGPRPSESVWNDGPNAAGGGGVSSFWIMPGYQSQQPSYLHVITPASSGSPCAAPSGACREVPDVSADASPASGYLIYWNGNGDAVGVPPPSQGWQVVGGTSGAAPAWAAFIALANASAACNGLPIGFANPALYNAAATAYAGVFNDVISGNNDMTGTNLGQFAAGPAYDMASGLGSPNGAALASALCTDSISLANPGAQRSVVGSTVGLQINAADTRGAPVAFSAAGLPSGLSINSSNGRISGRARQTGSSTVTVTVSDGAGTTARTTFTWTIQGNPSLSRTSLSGVRSARPKLTFTLAAGRDAPLLRAIRVTLPRGLHFSRSHTIVTVTARSGRRVKVKVSLRHGGLVLSLRKAAGQVRVTVSYPRLRTSGGVLAARLAHHRSTRVTITVRATDAANLTTKLTARPKPRR